MTKGIKALLERLPEKVLVSVNGYKKYLKRNFVLEYAQETKWKARAYVSALADAGLITEAESRLLYTYITI